MNTFRTLSAALIAFTALNASAQSSVTIAGQIEAQVVRQNGGTSAVANFPAVGLRNRVDGLSSRLIFRGTENLGGGLSAYFVLDHRFKTDTGAQSATAFWDGQSVVGIASPYGTVYAGRDYVPAFYPGVRIDPWGYDGSIGSIQGQAWAGYAVSGGVRADSNLTHPADPILTRGWTLAA
jgi:predicted porin